MHMPHDEVATGSMVAGRMSALPDIHVSVPGNSLSVRAALSQMMGALAPLELEIEERGSVELVLAEAMNNIVEHAYPRIEEAGFIRITCHHDRDGLHFKIRDTGLAMPNGRAPVGNPVNLDVDTLDMPEGGFGWFLIQDLARDVVYRRVGIENQLTFRMAVAVPASN